MVWMRAGCDHNKNTRSGETAVRRNGDQPGLSDMAYIDHNCMKRCDSHEVQVLPVDLPGELAEAQGTINGMESQCASPVLKCGVW